MQGLIGQGCRAACAAVLLVLALAGTAHAADAWRPVSQGCVSLTGSGGACGLGRAADGLWKVVVAPGGRHAYGISEASFAILVFDRDPISGVLTQRGAGGCLSESGSSCAKVRGVVNPHDIVISPDGANIYVGSIAGGGTPAGVLAVFDRNPTTGDLTQKPGTNGCFTRDGAYDGVAGQCGGARGVNQISSMAMSPDGRHLYTGTGIIGIFKRDTRTGELSQAGDSTGCVANNGNEGCAVSRALSISRQMALSPDGASLYVPSASGVYALTILDRDPASGSLREKSNGAGCIAVSVLSCSVDEHLFHPLAVTVSPDSRHVYVSVIDGVLTFARRGDGSLAFQSCVTDSGNAGCSTGRGLRFVSYSAMSPDGQTLVAGLERADEAPGFVVFNRDANGNLAQPAGVDGCVSPTTAAWIRGTLVAGQCLMHPAAGANGQVTFVDDNNFIAASHPADAAISFKRDLYPQCASLTVNITQNVAAPLPFSCSDRNGDALTYAITGNPIAGALGAIDQPGGRVFYNPFSAFSGSDSIGYRATAAGLPSNEATLQLNVLAPPAPAPPPPTRPRTVNAGVTYNWDVKGTRHTITRLTVRNLPTDAVVTISCSGKRCPLKNLAIKRSHKSTMNALNAKALSGKNKSKTRFRAGQTVDIKVSAPGMNTKMLRFVLRKGVVAKHRTYCIPLGSTKARRGACA